VTGHAGAPRASRTAGRRTPTMLTGRPRRRHPGSHRRRTGRRGLAALAGLAVAVWSLVGLTAGSAWLDVAGLAGAIVGASVVVAVVRR
jgi:hypothetical protein